MSARHLLRRVASAAAAASSAPAPTRAALLGATFGTFTARRLGSSALIGGPVGGFGFGGIAVGPGALLAPPSAAAALLAHASQTRGIASSAPSLQAKKKPKPPGPSAGENAAAVRQRILHDEEWLGISIDDDLNADNALEISTDASPVKVYVIPTDEEAMIARQTAAILEDTVAAGAPA